MKNYSDIVRHLSPVLGSEPLDHGAIRQRSVDAARALLKLDEIMKYFTEEELAGQISSLIYEVHKSSDANREKLLQNKFPALIDSLRSQVDDWRVVVPLDNLTIGKKQRLRVGNVTFSQFSAERVRSTLARIRAYLLQNPHYMNRPQFINEYIKDRRKRDVGKLVGTTCAETVIFGRADKAYDEALPRIEEAVAGIKLFRYLNDDSYGRYFGIRGSIVTSILRQMLLYPKGPGFVGSQIERVGTLFEVELDTERMKFMKKNGLREFSEILAKPNRSDLENRIVSSVLWFGKATDVVLSHKRTSGSTFEVIRPRKRTKLTQAEMMNPYDRLLKLTVSLETLLIFDQSEPIRSNLAERVAFVVAKNYSSRKNVVNFVKKMYAYRSSIVHHGGKGIPPQDLANLMFLTQSVIMWILKNRQKLKLTSHESLQEWFEKKKFD